MAVKKIIDIEVNDEAFKRFMEHFKEFEKTAGELPKEWKSIDDAMTKAGKGFSKSMGPTEAILTGMAASSATIVEAIHQAAKAQRHFEHATRRSHHAMRELGHTAGGVAKTVLGIGKELLKFGSIGGALGGLAGGFGLDMLAGSALSRQRTARGLGMTPGQTASLNTYFNRYGNAQGVAMNVANIRSDISKRYLFTTLGMGASEVNNASNYGLTVSAMEHAQKLVKGWSDQSWLTNAQALGITNVISPEMLRVLRNSSTSGLQQAATSANKDVGRLGFDDKTARDWSKFSIALHRATIVIETGLIKGLDALTPKLTKISHAVSDWISSFLQSPTFMNDMKQFAAAIKQLAHETVNALRYFGLIPGGATGVVELGNAQAAHPNQKSFSYVMYRYQARHWGFAYTPSRIHGDLAAASKKYGVPLKLLERQAMMESGYGRQLISPAGALGVMQLMPGTAHDLGVKYPMNPDQNIAGGVRYDQQLLHYYHGDKTKAFAAYNWGAGHVNAAIKKYGSSWLSHAPAETRGYVRSILGAGAARVDERVRSYVGTQDPLVQHLNKVVSALHSKAAQKTTVVIRNQTGANLALQANGMVH